MTTCVVVTTLVLVGLGGESTCIGCHEMQADRSVPGIRWELASMSGPLASAPATTTFARTQPLFVIQTPSDCSAVPRCLRAADPRADSCRPWRSARAAARRSCPKDTWTCTRA